MLPHFAKLLDRWKQWPEYAFLFHNNAAMNRLLGVLLQQQQQQNKMNSPRSLPLADLWRAPLVLREYGGIYTDIDNAIFLLLLMEGCLFRDNDNSSISRHIVVSLLNSFYAEAEIG
jgi:hypothetical protein